MCLEIDLTDEHWEAIKKFVPKPERDGTMEKCSLRLLTRFEHKAQNLRAFLKVRCIVLLLRRL